MQKNNIYRVIEHGSSPTILSIGIIVAGIVGLYLSTLIRNPYTLLYPLALIGGTVAFLLLSRRNQTGLAEFHPNVGKVILILYLWVLTAVIFTYHAAGFWRTDMVFYLTFSLYVLTGVYCLTRSNITIALSLILISGAVNRLTAHYASERYIGVDIYGHSSQIAAIATDGTLEVFKTSKYFYAPLYHIQAAIGEIALNVSVKDALALTTILSFLIVPALVVYALTNMFWEPRTALFASLLYTFSDQVLGRAIHPIPNTLSVVFFALIVLMLCRYLTTSRISNYLLFAISYFILMLTHQASLFIATVTTGVLTVVIVAKDLRSFWNGINIALFTGLVVFVDFITTRYRGPSGEASFFDVVLGQFIGSLLASSGVESRPEVSFPQDSSISPGGAAAMADIQLVGSAMLLFFAIIGALYWVQAKRRPKPLLLGLSFGVTVAVLLTVALAGPIIGLRNLMPNRWWPFIYLFLTILAAVGIVMTIQAVSSAIPESKVATAQLILLVALLVPFVTLMVGAGTASTDNPFIDDGFDAERYSVTEQEIAATGYIDSYAVESITVRQDLTLSYSAPGETASIRMEHSNPDSIVTDEPQYLINRKYITEKPVRYIVDVEGEQWSVHGGVPIDNIDPKYRMLLYNNGDDEILWIQR